MTRLTIGRAAKAANVNVETIRFYERRGLITQPRKPAGGGAREYDDYTIARVRFVRQAQDIGFSLREIAELLSLRADPGADCAAVRARAMERGAVADGPRTAPQPGPKRREKHPMKTTLLAIEGMHCDGCACTIEALLTRLPGVRKVEASFEERRARVLHDPVSVSETALAEAIAKGGFTARAESR